MSFFDFLLKPVTGPLKNAAKNAYDDPGSRDLGQEWRQTFDAESQIAPERYALEAQYRPLYDQLGLQSFNNSLYGSGGQGGLLDAYTRISPQLSALDRQASNAQRGADVSDLSQYGPQMMAARRSFDPNQASLLDSLNQQTLGDVQAGYDLPTGLRNSVNQSTRSGQAARGLGLGPSDAYAETLAQSEAANRWRGDNLNRGMQMAGVNAATADPWLSVLTRQAQPNGAAGLLGQGQKFGDQSQFVYDRFNPTDPYAQDVYNTNYNAQAARKIGIGNAQAGIASAAVGAL